MAGRFALEVVVSGARDGADCGALEVGAGVAVEGAVEGAGEVAVGVGPGEADSAPEQKPKNKIIEIKTEENFATTMSLHLICVPEHYWIQDIKRTEIHGWP